MTEAVALKVAKVRARLVGVHPDRIKAVCRNRGLSEATQLLNYLADRWDELDHQTCEVWASPPPNRRR